MGHFGKWVLYGVFLLAVVFQVEFPVLSGISGYASINLEDIVIAVIGLTAVWERMRSNDWSLTIKLPETTAFVLLFTAWITLTVLIATIRSPDPISASYLWLLKWFEFVVVLIILQDEMTTYIAENLIRLLILLGALISGYAVINSGLGAYRFRAFFDNPNTASVFFNLVLFTSLWRTFQRRTDLARIGYGITAVVAFWAVFTTGSRSGVIGLFVGLAVTLFLVRRRFTVTHVAIGLTTSIGSIVAVPLFLDASVFHRLIDWVEFSDDNIQLASTTAAGSFETRLDLIDKSMYLYIENPIFGYGWYASPSRVGYLDVHYTTMLVEIGAIGLILILIIYGFFIKEWYLANKDDIFIGGACISWYVGILAQSIGGNMIRSPQILFLTAILLVATVVLAESDIAMGYEKRTGRPATNGNGDK